MHHFWQGKPTKQGHKGIPEGMFEEEQGRKGFFGPVSHIIKERPSTRWTSIDGPLGPHLYDLVELKRDAWQWQRLFFNSDCVMSYLTVTPGDKNREAYRSGDSDVCYFCHKGGGTVLTEYGMLEFRGGSYIVIPKCVTHNIIAD